MSFEIDLGTMAAPERQVLLDLLHGGATLTVAVRGDAPGAPLQLFDVCAPGAEPVVDQCVQVLWLDAAGAVISPGPEVEPAVVRFESLVGHFSTYSVVAAIDARPGDADRNGVIGIGDYFAIDRGRALRLGGWSNGDFNLDGLVDAGDYVVIDRAFLSEGQGAGLGAGAAVVPEPSTALLILAGGCLGAVFTGRSRRRGSSIMM